MLLREKGMASAAKRADRATTEGLVGYCWRTTARAARWSPSAARRSPSRRATSSRRSQEGARTVVEAEGSTRPRARPGADRARRAKLGENIAIAGARSFRAVEAAQFSAYVHPPANKLGVLDRRSRRRRGARRQPRDAHLVVAIRAEVAREDVPAELVAAEREIYLNSDEVQSKPEQAREKIVEGMLNKRFYAERGGVLAEQPWIHDGALTVGKVLADAGAFEVLEF